MARLKGIELATASNGTLFIDDTDAHTGNFCAIYIPEDSTTISALLDEDGASLLTTLGISGKSLFKGMLITLPDSVKNISSVTLSAGSVNMING
jgi:hypothetical protein